MSLYNYLSSEGRPHYNTERDFSNPRYVDWIIIPPTFIAYNTFTKKIENIDEVKDYLSKLFNDKTEDFTNQVLELALNKMKDDLNLSIKEAIELALDEITVVYGGSASDVIDGGTDPWVNRLMPVLD